jgi:hypothetical protein
MTRRFRASALLAAMATLALSLSACNNEPVCPTCDALRNVQSSDFALCVSLVPNPSTPEEVCQDVGIDYVVID